MSPFFWGKTFFYLWRRVYTVKVGMTSIISLRTGTKMKKQVLQAWAHSVWWLFERMMWTGTDVAHHIHAIWLPV